MSSTNRQTRRTGELPAVSFLNLRFLAVFVLFSAYCQLSNWTRSSSSRRVMSLRGPKCEQHTRVRSYRTPSDGGHVLLHKVKGVC